MGAKANKLKVKKKAEDKKEEEKEERKYEDKKDKEEDKEKRKERRVKDKEKKKSPAFIKSKAVKKGESLGKQQSEEMWEMVRRRVENGCTNPHGDCSKNDAENYVKSGKDAADAAGEAGDKTVEDKDK